MAKSFAIVDPLSTGADFVRFTIERGHPCLCVWSPGVPEQLKKVDFNFQAIWDHAGDVAQTVAWLREFDVEDVIVGCETGVELHAAIAAALDNHDHNSGNCSHIHAARRNKYLQGEIVRSAGLAAVCQSLVKTPEELEVFINRMDQICEEAGTAFKAVVKPADGGSSDGLAICDSPGEVREAFRNLQHRDDMSLMAKALGTTYDSLLCQEFLAGDEYVVDTVSCNGEHKVAAIWKYDKRPFCGTPAVYHGQHVENCTEFHENLVTYIADVLTALCIKDGAIHSEVILTERGPVLVEANCRLHGGSGLWLPAAEASIGYTQVSALYDAVFSHEAFAMLPRIPPSPLRCCSTKVFIRSPQSGTIKRLKDENLAKIRSLMSFHSEHYAPCVAVGQFVKKTVSAITTHGCFILCAADEETLMNDYHIVQDLINEGLFVFDMQDLAMT